MTPTTLINFLCFGSPYLAKKVQTQGIKECATHVSLILGDDFPKKMSVQKSELQSAKKQFKKHTVWSTPSGTRAHETRRVTGRGVHLDSGSAKQRIHDTAHYLK